MRLGNRRQREASNVPLTRPREAAGRFTWSTQPFGIMLAGGGTQPAAARGRHRASRGARPLELRGSGCISGR